MFETTLGIDEAGRGPLIGPLVLCGLLVSTQEEADLLATLGVADSKALSPTKREILFEKLSGYKRMTIAFEPAQIDAINLNTLEISGVVDLAKALRPQILILDAPVAPPGIKALTLRLIHLISKQQVPVPKMILENKADSKYPACMAASIIAKVTRDRAIEELKHKFGDFGSGYPSDPKTRSFIANLDKDALKALDPHIRKKWATFRQLQRVPA